MVPLMKLKIEVYLSLSMLGMRFRFKFDNGLLQTFIFKHDFCWGRMFYEKAL